MVIAALTITALVACVGFALDYAGLMDARRRSQGAADAAAIAAIQNLEDGGLIADATAKARQVASANGFSSSELTMSYLLADATTTTTTEASVSYVKARVATSYKTLFMGVVGIGKANTFGQAIAGRSSSSTSQVANCVVCILKTSANAYSMGGSSRLTVVGGPVHSNGGMAVTGGSYLSAPSISASGAVSGTGYSVTPISVSNISDPLRDVPVPSSAGLLTYSGSNDLRRGLGPGIYTGSNQIVGNTVLSAGVYIFTSTVAASGSNAKLTAPSGTTLYFTCADTNKANAPRACNSGESGASFDLTGGSGHNIQPPSSGTYKGLSIFYDRNNISDLKITGTTITVTGTIYAKSANFKTAGSGSQTSLDSRIVVGTMQDGGSSSVTLINNFTVANNVAASTQTFPAKLVE